LSLDFLGESGQKLSKKSVFSTICEIEKSKIKVFEPLKSGFLNKKSPKNGIFVVFASKCQKK